MSTIQTLGKPEAWYQRLVPDFCKSHETQDVVDRYAGRLDEGRRNRLESTLGEGTPQAKAQAFAAMLSEVSPGAEVRPLFAVSLEGLEQIRQEANNPVVDLTDAVCRGAAYVVPGADSFYLSQLTTVASTGLNAYAKDPNTDLLGLAAQLEGDVGFVLEEMAPTLTKAKPELKLPLEVFQVASQQRDGVNAASWLSELQAKPDASLPHAFVTVMKDSVDFEAFVDTLDHLSYHSESSEIRELAEKSLDRISDGVTPAQLLEQWNVR